MPGCLVLPVTALDAWAWAQGRLTDAHLVSRANLLRPRGEALFIIALHGRQAFPEMLRQCRLWPAAMSMVFRTANPVVARYALRRGCVPITADPGGAWRYWVGEDRLRNWLTTAGRPRSTWPQSEERAGLGLRDQLPVMPEQH